MKNTIPVRIIEKCLTSNRGTRGAGVMPRTLEVLKSLGIIGEVSTHRGIDAPPTNLYKLPGGTDVLKIVPPMMESLEKNPSTPLNRMWFVSQEVLERILRTELEKYNCFVEFGKELTVFEQDGNGVVADIQIHTEDGASTKEQIIASYLVGADGGKGTVRRILKLRFLGSPKDDAGMIVANAVVENLSTDTGHIWKDPTGPFFAFRPYEAESKKFVISILGVLGDFENTLSADDVRSLVVMHTGRSDIIIEDFEWLSYFKPQLSIVEQFHIGQTFLVGDAAHVHPPHGGQGLNTSIQDSFNLAWKMALVLKGLSPNTLLESYDEERLPVIAKMLEQVAGIQSKVKEQTDPASGLSRSQELMMMGINYRWSSLVVEQRSSAADKPTVEDLHAHSYCGWAGLPQAGDRAPDASGLIITPATSDTTPRGENMTTLFDVFRPDRHTVLLFVNSEERLILAELQAALGLFSRDTVQTLVISRQREVISYLTSVSTFHAVALDEQGYATAAYLGDSSTSSSSVLGAVVRPDGFIGAFVKDAGGLQEYHSKIFK